MEDQTKLTLATAVLGGYVLGRTKKGRLALTVATVVAGRGLGFGPKELAAEGARRLADVPQVAQVQEQVREQGIQAVRGALSAVTDRGMGSLADAISGRTASISRKADDTDDADEEEDEDQAPEDSDDEEEDEDESQEPEEDEEEPANEEEDEPEEEEEEEPEEEEEEEPAPAPRRKAAPERRGTRPAPKKKAPAKKTAAKKTAPAKKAAKKTASSRTSRRR